MGEIDLDLLDDLLTDAYSSTWNALSILHAGQKKLDEAFRVSSKHKLFVGNISRQFGKTTWASARAINKAHSSPNMRIKYATAFQTDLMEFIIPTFEMVLDDCPSDMRPTKVGSKYKFPNGSEIKFIGLDKNPNALRGNTIDMIVIDECGFVTNLEYIYKSVIVPATLHRPNCRIILISTPPETPAHPFVDFVRRAQAEGCYAEMNIYENPMLDEKAIDDMAKELGGKDSTAFKREALCQLITDADQMIVPEWRKEYAVDTPKPELRNYYHNYSAMDLGVKDYTAGLYGYYDFKRARLIIEDESEMNGPQMTTDKLAAQVKEKEKNLWGSWKVHRRIADNNNPLLLLDMTTLHSLTFHPTSKDELHAMINELRIFVRSGRLEVNPRCKKLIGCLEYGVWNQKRTEFSRSNVYGHYDWLAALVYLVRNLDQHSNPIPHDHAALKHTHMIKEDRVSNNAQAFSKLIKMRRS